jgi:DNA end-binding protein Ku
LPDQRQPQQVPARAFWSGTLTFGLVSIPVDLFAGVHGRQTSMRMVDAKGRPLGRQYYTDEHEDALAPDDLVRGYETGDGKLVVVTDEELESVAPEMSRDIELRTFVPRDEIAPPYYQRPYFLAPSGRSQKAYQLLAQTMQQTGRVGIGTFVMRGRQYLVAILSDGKVLRAATLRFASELRSPRELGLTKPAKPARKDVKRFSDAIASLTRDALDMEELSDQYAQAIQALVREKEEKGKDIIRPKLAEAEEEAEGGAQVIDLMKLLKQRIAPSGKATARPARKAGRANGRRKRSSRRASRS